MSNDVAMSSATGASVDSGRFDALKASHRGEIWMPGQAQYEDARIIWNSMIDKRPGAIARPTGPADVIACVDFARDHGIALSVLGGGHNVAGHALIEDGLVIDLRDMRRVRVDPKKKTAWVDGGCILGDVDRETQLFGLAAPLGIVSLTGVAGLTLHGGLGYLRRKHGMACDAVRTFELVTAQGDLVRASANENADLFWALRGAGGNFGVVTGFEFDLFPLGPRVVQLGAMYPASETRRLMPIWRDFMMQSPRDLVSNFLVWSMPDWDVLPEGVRGRDVCIIGGLWTGDVDAGLKFIQPLRELGGLLGDLSGPMTYCEAQTGFDPFFAKGERPNYWKSSYADRLDDEVMDCFVDKAMQRPDPWTLMVVWHMGGGAYSGVSADATAFGDRSAPWTLSIDGSWEDPAKTEQAVSWIRETWNQFRAFSKDGGAYMNFAGMGEEGTDLLKASYGATNYARLVDIKRKWDPQNTFWSNQNIHP